MTVCSALATKSVVIERAIAAVIYEKILIVKIYILLCVFFFWKIWWSAVMECFISKL